MSRAEFEKSLWAAQAQGFVDAHEIERALKDFDKDQRLTKLEGTIGLDRIAAHHREKKLLDASRWYASTRTWNQWLPGTAGGQARAAVRDYEAAERR